MLGTVSPKGGRINHGNRYNVEAMARFLPVGTFFSHVYLVDLSPSLCNIARKRFERLGWKNVSVICQDALSFSLAGNRTKSGKLNGTADMVTMSYSLSMIPGEGLLLLLLLLLVVVLLLLLFLKFTCSYLQYRLLQRC